MRGNTGSIGFIFMVACAPPFPEALELEEAHGFADEGTSTTYPQVETGSGWRSVRRVLLDVHLAAGTAMHTEMLTVEEDRPVDAPEPWLLTEEWTATRERRQVIMLPPAGEEEGLSCAVAPEDWGVVLCGQDGTLSEWRERAE